MTGASPKQSGPTVDLVQSLWSNDSFRIFLAFADCQSPAISDIKTRIAHLNEADGTPLPDEEEKDCGSLLRNCGFVPENKTASNTALGTVSGWLQTLLRPDLEETARNITGLFAVRWTIPDR
jgi:hypothetical protein